MNARAIFCYALTAFVIGCGPAPTPDGTGGGGGTNAGGGTGTDGGAGTADKLPLGGRCAEAGQCLSGFCVDSVCCDVACGGQCQACSAARTSGSNGTCAPLPNGGVCRPAMGACDVAEVCSGGVCAADGFATAGTSCRSAAGSCDLPEICTGSTPQCPTDALVEAGVVCRSSTGVCDVAETCTGTGAQCPLDSVADAGTPCRNAVGACDSTEVCDGSQVACPGDTKLPANQVCRPSAGPCDLSEFCSGATNDCPTDLFAPTNALACAPNRCSGNTADCSSGCTTHANCAPNAQSFCSNGSCQTGRLAFVTSNKYASNIGGVSVGDQRCQAHAADAGFGGTFLAWLSQPGSSPSTRFNRDGGAWIRPIATKDVIARDWADLVDGTLTNTLGHTEKGMIPPSGVDRLVWTGTNTLGNVATYSNGTVTDNHCSSWSSNLDSFHAVYGQIGFLDSNWTDTGFRSVCGSSGALRLYCFQQ